MKIFKVIESRNYNSSIVFPKVNDVVSWKFVPKLKAHALVLLENSKVLFLTKRTPSNFHCAKGYEDVCMFKLQEVNNEHFRAQSSATC